MDICFKCKYQPSSFFYFYKSIIIPHLKKNKKLTILVYSNTKYSNPSEYAMEAVKRGAIVVGIRGKNVVVLGAEMRETQQLQDSRTIRKILKVDDHVSMAFAGLTADSRVLVNKARLRCQSHRLTVEDAPTVEWIARTIAEVR
tara:strand:- start:256 stop:684 length:429 start_codon:yes stop_codon:yes gene_type:complete